MKRARRRWKREIDIVVQNSSIEWPIRWRNRDQKRRKRPLLEDRVGIYDDKKRLELNLRNFLGKDILTRKILYMILRIMHMKRMTMLKMEVETEGGKKGEGERRGGREKERKKEGRQEETGS